MSSALRQLVAAAMVVTICASCSNGTPPASTSADDTPSSIDETADSTHAQALQFAACMRENGIDDFPDPDVSGALTIDAIANGSSLDTNSAQFNLALTACEDLQPPGFTGETRSAEEQEAALEFAQCIRDNGVNDFPDPTTDSPLVDTNRIPSAGTERGMTVLHAAMQLCGDLATRAGVEGP